MDLAGLLRTNLFVVFEVEIERDAMRCQRPCCCTMINRVGHRLPAVQRFEFGQAIYWRLAHPFHLLPFDLSLAKRSRFISGIVCATGSFSA